MLKKFLSVMLVLAIVAALAGCGGNTSTASDDAQNVSNNKADTIEIVSWWDETPTGNDEEGKLQLKRMKDIEKKYNVQFKFTVLPADEISTRFVTEVMSGGSLGDFVNMRHYWAFPEYAKKGYLLNMSDYLDFSDEAFTASDTEIATYDGNVYGFSMEPLRVGYSVYFNKAIFEKYGIEEPYAMYKNKTWTWDKFFDIAKKLTKTDTNGNTVLWGCNPLARYQFVELFVASNGGSFVKYVNGEAKSNLTHTGTIKGIEQAYQSTYIDKFCDVYDETNEYNYTALAFQNGQYAMFIGGSDSMDDFKNNMEDKFGIVPIPLGNGQTEYVNLIRERHFKVAASTADKERMKKLLPILYEYYYPFDNAEDLLLSGFENYTWDEESVEVCMDLVKSQYVPEHLDFPDPYWDIVVVQGVNKALKGEMTATAAMKAIDDAWQATISK